LFCDIPTREKFRSRFSPPPLPPRPAAAFPPVSALGLFLFARRARAFDPDQVDAATAIVKDVQQCLVPVRISDFPAGRLDLAAAYRQAFIGK
jgi:hypothetical protein